MSKKKQPPAEPNHEVIDMATDYSERIGPASVALAGRPTSSTAHMTAVERADGIRQMLLDLWQLADRDGCIAAGWALEYLATPDDRIAKLQAFKEYVHARLDAAGVPTDPDSPHRAEGCRIGGRLDYVLMLRSAGAVAAAVRVRKWKAGIALKDIYPGAKIRSDEVDMLATDWRDLAMDYLDILHTEQPREGGGE